MKFMCKNYKKILYFTEKKLKLWPDRNPKVYLIFATKGYIDEEDLEKSCKNPYTPLHKAVLNGDVKECAALASNVEFLSSGDLRGDSPLHLAVRWINSKGVELMKVLTSCDADVNIKNKWDRLRFITLYFWNPQTT
uniref:Uncharacterized protein n=1 Tax=Magallana gigas TaxID=29159 RepID=K1R2W6_MAGGI